MLESGCNDITGVCASCSHAQPDRDREYQYLHSSFNDLIITGLIGLRPRTDQLLVLEPLVPEGALAWFAIDRLRYRGNELSIAWDEDGQHFLKGPGLSVWVNGERVVQAPQLQRQEIVLSNSSSS